MLGKPRTFRVLETAKGTLIKTLFLEVQVILQSVPRALPESCFSMAARSTLFRMLSGLLCNVHAKMRRYHKIFPYALFKLLLRDPECTEAVYKIPTCMREQLSKMFFDRYPEPEDLCDSAFALLEALGLMIELDA